MGGGARGTGAPSEGVQGREPGGSGGAGGYGDLTAARRLALHETRAAFGEWNRHSARNPALSFLALAGNDSAVSPLDRSHSSKTRSVVILGSDLPLNPSGVVVLDPQLRLVLFHEFFDLLAALGGLLLVGVERRNFLERNLFRIVIEIARQQDVPGVGELEIQGLVPGCMSGRGLDDHRAVAKHIMILAIQQNRLAVSDSLE